MRRAVEIVGNKLRGHLFDGLLREHACGQNRFLGLDVLRFEFAAVGNLPFGSEVCIVRGDGAGHALSFSRSRKTL